MSEGDVASVPKDDPAPPTPEPIPTLLSGGTWTDKAQALGVLVTIVRSNLLALVILLVLVASSAFGYKFYQNIDQVLARAFPTHDFRANLDADQRIQRLLARARDSLNADRVVVIQYHNGTVGDGRLPFRKFSAQYAETAPGVAYAPEEYQSLPLSLLAEVNTRMWGGRVPACAVVAVEDVESNVLRQRMKDSGTSITFECPMVSSDGTPVGNVVAAYLQKITPRPADDEIYKVLRDLSSGVSAYLESARQ